MEHTRKLKFSDYAHLQSINKIFQFCHAQVFLCNVGEVYIFEHPSLEHARGLILSDYVLLAWVI